MTNDLSSLLIGAAESPPDRRDEWREPIALHGDWAVRALGPWLDRSDLRPFALSTILRAAELGAAPIAQAVLRQAQRRALASAGASELGEAADALGQLRPEPAAAPRLTRLVRGRLYRRPELFATGLGGNPQAGISYPAKGDHALLLSTPGGHQRFGYNDRWDGEDEYLYYGEWKGTPEMSLKGGNAAIIERSPKLYFFQGQGKGLYRLEGAFEYLTHTLEWTKRDGNPQRALVLGSDEYRIQSISSVAVGVGHRA